MLHTEYIYCMFTIYTGRNGPNLTKIWRISAATHSLVSCRVNMAFIQTGIIKSAAVMKPPEIKH